MLAGIVVTQSPWLVDVSVGGVSLVTVAVGWFCVGPVGLGWLSVGSSLSGRLCLAGSASGRSGSVVPPAQHCPDRQGTPPPCNYPSRARQQRRRKPRRLRYAVFRPAAVPLTRCPARLAEMHLPPWPAGGGSTCRGQTRGTSCPFAGFPSIASSSPRRWLSAIRPLASRALTVPTGLFVSAATSSTERSHK